MASFTKSTHTQTQQGRETLFLEGSCRGMDFLHLPLNILVRQWD